MTVKTGQAITIKVGEDLVVNKEADLSLKGLQTAVEGYIERVSLRYDNETNREIMMWVNEEGKFSKERNIALVRMVGDEGQVELLDIVHGDVIITSGDDEGDTVGLTDEEVEFVKSMFIKDLKESLEYGVTTSIKLY